MARRQRADREAIHGLLVVDKTVGLSSMDVVRKVRRAAGGVKTGNAGTLDPLATGVIVCCLGRATRCVEKLMGLNKVYEAEVDLSAFTTTDDREGDREEIAVAAPPDEPALDRALRQFVGQIEQTPPAYSAVHVDGRRAYKLARRGEMPNLPARTVRIDEIELMDYAWPNVSVRIVCGRGTYIRSVARDLGAALGTGGHLAALRRTAVGPYRLPNAAGIDRLDQPITQVDLLDLPL